MENQVEVWKLHPEIVGIEVSTFGRVRTLDKVTSSEKGTRFIKGRILKQYDTAYVYLQVSIPVDRKWIMKRVHRLIAQTFIPNPDNLPEVNHKDCDRTNNNVDNLEWCSHSYNQKYRDRFGISNTEALGSPLFAINLATSKVSRFESQSKASIALGVNSGSINAVISGRTKQGGGYLFVNADDTAIDVTKHKLHEIDKTRLTAADTKSMDFVSQVLAG